MGTHLIWAYRPYTGGGFFQLFDANDKMMFTASQHSLVFCRPYTSKLAKSVGLEPIEEE